MNAGSKIENPVGKILMSLGLLIAFMLPFSIQFVHALDGHEHVVCTDQDNHMDQTPVKCEICSVQLAVFDYDPIAQVEMTQPEYFMDRTGYFTSLQISSPEFNSNPLRGPPFLS